MIKKIRGSLTAKVFLWVAGLLVLTCLVIYGLILLFMPYTYKSYLTDELVTQLSITIDGLDGMSYDEAVQAVIGDEQGEGPITYIIEYTEDEQIYTLDPETGEMEIWESDPEQADSYVEVTDKSYSESIMAADTLVLDGEYFTIMASASSEQISQARDVLVAILPYMLAFILLISLTAASLYSRFMTRPIRALSDVAKQMSAADLSARSDIQRGDEIGILSGSLNELAGSLDTALQELREANTALREDIDRERAQERQRRDLFRAVSHELKTPLTILRGELEGMLRGVGVYRDRDSYLRHSLQTTQSMEQLVQEIMTISKMEAENFALKLQPVRLDELVEETLDRYATLAEEKNMSIQTALEPLTCRADKKVLGKALSNLIGNALTYSPDHEQVSVVLSREGERGILTIENSGARIAEPDLDRVFEPFYRVEKSRSRHSGGSGLGLYIVQTILNLHDMPYHMENTEAGVAFTLEFVPAPADGAP